MTRSRVTQESLTISAGHLEQLAWDRHDLYPAIATLLDLLIWLDGEINAARQAAAYGSGAAEVHVLGSSSRGVEARLRDPLLADLRKLRRCWQSQVEQLVYDMQDAAGRAANWPQRTQDAG